MACFEELSTISIYSPWSRLRGHSVRFSTYLSRSLRRTQHTTHEGQIVKAICAGQNLAVFEGTFEVLREEGAIVEEAVSDDEEGKQGEDGVGRSFDEKGVLHGRTEGGTKAVDVHVGVKACTVVNDEVMTVHQLCPCRFCRPGLGRRLATGSQKNSRFEQHCTLQIVIKRLQSNFKSKQAPRLEIRLRLSLSVHTVTLRVCVVCLKVIAQVPSGAIHELLG
ncbi:hypothetical protein L210DRAFT_2299922 [Boletus edulis BED1]|uniref:Uncharacterized protein n=1 Tax=Boletus edulis BED1 TaxID=1328754 RepID=A0AAD4GCV1_BOLED|nr:hypothetical protein L210DRAFT_2299922 [Boletus edulis BED1]